MAQPFTDRPVLKDRVYSDNSMTMFSIPTSVSTRLVHSSGPIGAAGVGARSVSPLVVHWLLGTGVGGKMGDSKGGSGAGQWHVQVRAVSRWP